MTMTDDEYRYLTGSTSWKDKAAFYDAGTSCYENAWIDVFGFVTPKGETAKEAYQNERN